MLRHAIRRALQLSYLMAASPRYKADKKSIVQTTELLEEQEKIELTSHDLGRWRFVPRLLNHLFRV